MGEEAHLTVAVVDYERDGDRRLGAASAHLASLTGDDATVRVFVEPNERFRLPDDPSRDVIMIGPGTGVAPYRGFLQEREAQGATGRNWLVFGARHFASEFLYQVEWQDAARKGLLHRVDLAFSRDRTPRAYVQDRLREAGAELYAWLEGGAHLYVCGDAERMAPDVHAALVEIVVADARRARSRRGRSLRCAASPTSGATCGTSTEMSELSPVERIKRDSRLLRGTLVESLADPLTGAIREDDTVLIKFHGSYQQDDRDLREERRRQKLEPAYSFMIRTRLPGGVCTPAQWLALDEIARRYANGTLRLTTRQAFQFHGVIKTELKATMAAINAALIDTIAACGDVNRNVLASANPVESRAHAHGLRVGEAAVRAPAAAHPRLPRDLARRREGRRHRGGRADLRPDLPAAQVQGGDRRAAGERRGRASRTTSASSPSSRTASCWASTSPSAAAWAPPTAMRRPIRGSPTWSASCGRSSCSRSPRPWSRRSAISATARSASTRGSSTRSTTAASTGSWPRSRAGRASRSSRRARSSSPRPATASAGSRATTAAGT